MATEKKDSSRDSQSKADATEVSAEDLWDQLWNLAKRFNGTGLHERREDLVRTGVVLHLLCEDTAFRKVAHSTLRMHLKKKFGERFLVREIDEQTLLGAIQGAVWTRASSGADGLAAATNAIMYILPICPELYIRTEGFPHAHGIYGGVYDPSRHDDAFKAAEERVREAIAPHFADPDDLDFERIAKAAMRALGCDAGYVKNMFRE